MAQYQAATNDPTALAPNRNSEQRAPQFVGGSVDPTSGNLIPGSRDDAANGRAAAIEKDIADTPAQPTTRLGAVEPVEAPKTDYGALALNTGLNVGAAALGKTAGDALGKAFGLGGGGTAANPMDTVIGGGIGATGAGTGGGDPMFGGGGDPTAGGTTPFFETAYGGGGETMGGTIGGNSIFSGGGGGTVLCTYFAEKNVLSPEFYAADVRYGQERVSMQTLRGYRAWGVPLVHLMQDGGKVGALCERMIWPIVRRTVAQIVHEMGVTPTGDLFGKAMLRIGAPICWCIGLFVVDANWQALWAGEK